MGRMGAELTAFIFDLDSDQSVAASCQVQYSVLISPPLVCRIKELSCHWFRTQLAYQELPLEHPEPPATLDA